MSRWESPKSAAEGAKLAEDIVRTLPTLDDETEEFEEAVKEACAYAGCFNHNINRLERGMIMAAIAKLGEAAVSPVIEDLLDCSRAEQVTVTKTILCWMVNPPRSR